MVEKILVILNPWAGRGSTGRHRQAIEAALAQAGIPYELNMTQGPGGAIALARHGVERGFTQIVAVGGDGTINEVVNGIKGAEASYSRRVQLGIIPLGTGSDFVKVLDGVAHGDIAGAVQRIKLGRVRTIDLGRVWIADQAPRFFINGLAMGLDAQVAAESLKLPHLKGLAVYLVAIMRALVRYRSLPMTIEFDQQRIQRQLLFASIGNGRCQGGGFWLTPEALLDDGLLDLCLVDKMRLDEIIRHIPKVMSGKHARLKQVTMSRATWITLVCAAAIPVAADGEVLSLAAQRVLVEVLPEALDVLV